MGAGIAGWSSGAVGWLVGWLNGGRMLAVMMEIIVWDVESPGQVSGMSNNNMFLQ